MDRGDLLFVVVPFVMLAALSIGSVLILRRRWRMDRAAMRRAARLVEPDMVTPPRDAQPAAHPGWANPWLWVGVSAAFVVLGFVAWPALFGGVFLFIPFVWMSRSKPPTMDPRSNGHAKRERPV